MQLETENGQRQQTMENPIGQQAAGPFRVLLIEDDSNDTELIRIMLEDAGGGMFTLEAVPRLARGLERLQGGGIDVVLSDLSLPDSSGLDTFVRLHQHAPQTPIIVLSGLDDTTVAVRAVHEGAQDFLVKGQVTGQLLVRAMRYAIERKRMAEQLATYAAELRTKNAQLEADFNMAREIQEIFLPETYPSFPPAAPADQSAIQFYNRYLPAAAVGGDFFDVLPASEMAAGVFICDVMGHGVRAALVTAIMRGLVEELAPAGSDPSRFLSGLNRSLNTILRRTRDPLLATAFYGVIDAAAMELRFANGGHPSPLLIRRSARAVLPLKESDPRHGPGLGLFHRAGFPVCRCPLETEDVLLLFTDGLYEATNASGEEYGTERLVRTVERLAQTPTEQLLDELLQDVKRWSGTSEFEDDVCLLAAELNRQSS